MSKLALIPQEVIHAELRRRATRLKTLTRQHAKASRQVANLERQIALLGGRASGKSASGAAPSRTRPQNKTTLVEALQALLKGKTMAVSDMVDAVQKAGYKTNSRNFRTMVNIALINSGKFRRIERGQYTAK